MAATSIDAGAGAFIETGFPASFAVARGYLVHRIVVTAPGSTFAPGDPDPLPDTDFYVTSKRGVHHPWIAQAGEGAEAGPDISIGGHKLELPLGRSTDGEIQIRLIDVAAPIVTTVCGTNILIPEGTVSGLDANFLSNGWTIEGDPLPGITTWWGNSVYYPHLGGFTFYPLAQETWIAKTFDGTENGGAHWTPGQRIGAHFRIAWTLQTGNGRISAELEGGIDPLTGLSKTRLENMPFYGGDFWDIDEVLSDVVFDGYLSAVADASGELIVRLGGYNYAGSCNTFAEFRDVEFVSCEEVELPPGDAERYITGWLSDANARQQLLGRPAYLEESLDGGTTWSRCLYTGYLKQITLDQSLTYLLTLGDAGRGRRVSKAWAGLNPVEEFAP